MIDWFGPIFFESYGASELGFMTLISATEAIEKPGSVGKIISGGSIKILDDNMQLLPVGETVGCMLATNPRFVNFMDKRYQKYEDHL